MLERNAKRGFAPKCSDVLERVKSRLCGFQFLTGNAVKILALLTMTLDHFSKALLWPYLVEQMDAGMLSQERFYALDEFVRFKLYAVGTIAFPLFCFLLVEGFRHTQNRRRYLGGMLAFALISELPFDLCFFRTYADRAGTFPFYLGYQNVFFTLFLGLIALSWMERFSCKSKSGLARLKVWGVQAAGVAFAALAADWIRCDYGGMGILFIAAFYVGRRSRICQLLLFLLAYILTTGNQPPLCMLIACLILLLYNGKRGRLKWKYFFYAYYPAHIAVICMLQHILLPQ